MVLRPDDVEDKEKDGQSVERVLLRDSFFFVSYLAEREATTVS